jgi:hypothetical protein
VGYSRGDELVRICAGVGRRWAPRSAPTDYRRWPRILAGRSFPELRDGQTVVHLTRPTDRQWPAERASPDVSGLPDGAATGWGDAIRDTGRCRGGGARWSGPALGPGLAPRGNVRSGDAKLALLDRSLRIPGSRPDIAGRTERPGDPRRFAGCALKSPSQRCR